MFTYSTMKKFLLIGFVLVCGLAVATVASAAGSITLSPTAKTVVPGQTFTVNVTATPTGTAYTVKAVVRYPANLLEIKSFSFASGWLPLTQAGYDTVDNAGGVLVKTAGYPGGLAAGKVLGTITFKAKAVGSATVTVGGDSMLLDSGNANLFSAGGQTIVTIKQPAATATPNPSVSAAPSAAATPSVSSTPEASGAAAVGFLGMSGRTWGILIAVVIVAAVAYLLLRRRRGSGGEQPPSIPGV